MATESSLQTFPINLFVKKKTYYVVKNLQKCNCLCMNKSLLVSNISTMSLKENIAFVKLLELLLGSDIFTSFTDFQSQGMGNFGYI